MFCSCRISTDKCLVRSLCHSRGCRATCLIPIRVTTYAERLTKIAVVVTEIFGQICRFLLSRPTMCSCYPRKLWGYWTNVTKIVHNVEKFILFNILKSELWYYDLFWNGSAAKEIGQFFDFKWLPWQRNVPWQIWKYSTDPSSACKELSCSEKLVNIGPVYP